MHREEALELIKSTHTFPSEHRFHVIVRHGDHERLHVLVAERFAIDLSGRVEHVPSKNGRYLSVRLHLPTRSAEEVLDVYAFFQELDFLVRVM